MAATLVDIWSIPLRLTGEESDSVLSAEERARAARFHFPDHAARYRRCHSEKRRILGAYLGVPPGKVELVSGPSGKPRVAGDSALSFNLSHSGRMALLAVTSGMPVGVDIEAIRFDLDVEGLAGRFFTPLEGEKLRAEAAGEARARLFFRWWTRKEAILKADGSGIGGGLDRLDISGSPPNAVRFPPDGAEWWRVIDLAVEGGYTAAVAAPAGDWEVHWRAR
jgi:4'-phosphopantetheinyl transferase